MTPSLLTGFPKFNDAFTAFPVAGNLERHPSSSPSLDAGSKVSFNSRRRMRLTLSSNGAEPRPGFDASLRRFTRAVQTLLSLKDESAINTQDSYHNVSMCCATLIQAGHQGQNVYNSVVSDVTSAVKSAIESTVSSDDPLHWVGQLVDVMNRMFRRMDLLESILCDLNWWSSSQSNLQSIKEIFLEAFRKTVFNSLDYTSKIAEGIKKWSKEERGQSELSHGKESQHETSSRALIQRLIPILQAVGRLSTHFLQPYLAFTREFYTEEARTLPLKFSSVEYFAHCQSRLEEEQVRSIVPNDKSSASAIVSATEHALLPRDLLRDLSHNAIACIFKERRIASMVVMYRLYKRVDALDDLKAAFGTEIQAIVKRIVTDEPRDNEMVPRLLAEKAFLDQILVDACHERPFRNVIADVDNTAAPVDAGKDRPLSYAARDGFERGFLARKRKPAEMIAKYIDLAMIKGQREESEDVFWDELDAVLGLYRFTQDKDVFRTFYERSLAKRLLMQKSASDAMEQRVIGRLRDGYDPEFGKGNEMFKDIALSKDLLRDYFIHKPEADSRITAMVLQYSSWPFSKSESAVNLPLEMSEMLKAFTDYYGEQHKNRQLDWNHSLGTATLIARFDNGTKELSLSLYQALVLLLFENEDRLRYEDILDRTGIRRQDLGPTLQSLASGKVRVLSKVPPGKDVSETDEFIFNSDFQDKRRKIHIQTIRQNETVEEAKEIEQAIDLDRQASIDAAIVRIMKSSKKVMDEELKMKTVEALSKHFVPTVPDIKKRIEHLLEREYMERDEKNPNLFHYVA